MSVPPTTPQAAVARPAGSQASRTPSWRRRLRFYTFTRFRLLTSYARDARRRKGPPALVYQMGKVASTAVANVLRAEWPGPVAHLHTLRPDRLREEERLFRALFSERRTIPGYLIQGLYWNRALEHPPRRDGDRTLVVTLVRDPVARNLSTFFQTLDAHNARFGLAERMRSGGDAGLADDVREHFVADFDHRFPLTWFDRELATTLGIDVFSEPFDREAGGSCYENDQARALLMRVEDLATTGEKALRSFFQLPGLRLEQRNESAKKYYARWYNELAKTLRLPDSLLDDLYESKLVRHFYRDSEIAAFRARWRAT